VIQRGASQPWTTVLDGQRLRQLRGQHGLSQEELADRAGISRATVARLERQARPLCRHRTLARLTAALIMTHPPHPAADDTGTVQTSYILISAARELLSRTAELPGSKHELLAVLSEYRAALFDFATESERH